MHLVYRIFLVGLVAAITASGAQAAIIGRWDWTGSSDAEILSNKANPGTYDAVKLGTPTVGGGLAVIDTNSGSIGNSLSLGLLNEIYGARQFTWTFTNFIATEDTSIPIVGSADGAFAAPTYGDDSSWGWIEVSSSSTNSDSLRLVMWGYDASGEFVKLKSKTVTGLTIDPGIAYDIVVDFDGTRDDGLYFGYSVTPSGQVANPLTHTSFPVARVTDIVDSIDDTLLGKYTAASSINGDFTVGEIIFAVPEPGSLLLLLAAGGAMLVTRRRR